MHGLAVGIKDIWRKYGEVTAVGGVSLDIKAGEFVSLLGPSGSGKTTLLMMLAGFDEPQSGQLTVGDRDITKVPPNKRNIAMVFQRYALFPHMTVAENIAFPLRMRGLSKSEQERRVGNALEMVKLEGYAGRKPAELSGGQQQRVALARAIVFEPPVILMDEPLGALDKKLRQHMQVELKQLQQRLGATVIYVTHDQEEALTMSDRVAVMNHGKVMQYGPPRQLYEKPENEFVADFLGEMNFIDAKVRNASAGNATVELAGGALNVSTDRVLRESQQVRLAVRPEHIVLTPGISGEGVPATLSHLVFNGSHVAVLFSLKDGTIVRGDVGAQSPLAQLDPGAPVTWSCAQVGTHLFEGRAK